MEINKKVNGDTMVLAIEGKLDTNTAPQLEAAVGEILSEEKYTSMEIDMAKLDYLSSAGLRVLLSTQKKINALHGNLIITNASKTLKEVFEITGFMGVLTIA